MAKCFVGIDFGACNVKVSYYDKKGKNPKPLKLNKKQYGGAQTPNVICYEPKYDEEDKQTQIGCDVKFGDVAAKIESDENKISFIKRKLEKPSWQKFIPSLNKELTAEEIATDIFKCLHDKIDSTLIGRKIETAITVPVCFSEIQKQRIKKAAEDAGIVVNAVLTEPFAAAFSSEELFEDAEDEEQNVLVFDFGGSTLDLSLLTVECEDDEINVTERASAGMRYGGIDITQDIYDHIIKVKYADKIKEFMDASDRDEEVDEAELLRHVNQMKEEIFSGEDEVDDSIMTQAGKLIKFSLTRREVIDMFDKLKVKDRIKSLFDELLDSNDDIEKEDITKIYVFGGTSHVDYLCETIGEYFGDELYDEIDFDSVDEIYTAIADGAAKYLYFKSAEDDREIEIHNAIPFNIGLEQNGRFLKCINRSELYGLETKYRPLRIADLEAKNYRLSVYQCFSNADDIKIDDDGVVYMGSIQLDAKQYTAKDAIIFNLKMMSDGDLNMHFFELQENADGDDKEIVLIEDRDLVIGG